MKKTIIIALLGGILLPSLLSAQAPKREYLGSALDGVNFADYTTYSWLPFIDSVRTTDFDPQKLDGYITEAVDKEMANRGYTLVEENGELILQYLLVLENTRGTKTKPVFGRPNVSLGFGFGSYGSSVGVGVSGPKVEGYETIPVRYKEGALILGILSTELEMTVWRGTVNSIREDDGRLYNPKGVVAEVVPKIFKEFPKVKRKKEKKK